MFGKTLPRSEKLKAIGAFGGIAIVSALALDTMLFSGLQLDPPVSAATAAEPSDQYQNMADSGWRSDYITTASSWSLADTGEPLDDAHTDESLDGDVRAPPEGYREAVYNVPSEDELYREIAALYAAQDARAAARADEITEADEPTDTDKSDASAANPEPVTAYGNASPW